MTDDAKDPALVEAEARVGTVLRGKYRLDRVLGVGGMAVVYKATHRNDAEFAVKLLHPELSVREDVRSRFLREGRAANSVKHPGVVRVVDDDVAEDGAAFLVMEFLQGATVEGLAEKLDARLPLRAALSIATQLLDVLAAAHAKGVIHRDIKPANLFVSHDGVVKVLDFGIARVKDTAAGTGSTKATGMGLVLGTPAFMAPEQALGRTDEIDARTDIWAVGATLFNLLSGRSVHEAENPTQQMILVATTRAPSIAVHVPHLPPPIAYVIDRALAFEKEHRWPTCTAMQDAVEEACREAFGESTSKDALAVLLVEQTAGEMAATMAAPACMPTGATRPAVLHQPTSPARRAGQTTAIPVAAGSTIQGSYLPRRNPLVVWGGAGAAVLACAGLFVAGMSVRARPLAQLETATAAAPRPTADVPTVHLNPVGETEANGSVVAPHAAPTPPTPDAVPPRTAPTQRFASPPAPVRKSQSATVAAPPVAPPSAAAVVVPPPVAPTPAAAPQNCEFVKSYDTDGQPHFNKVCK